MKIIKRIVWTFVIIGILITSVALFLTSTRTGLRLVSNKVIAEFIPAEDVTFESVSGQLSDELVFNQIELKDLEWFPERSVIKIQRLAIRLKTFNPQDTEIDIENIRLFMPYSDPIVFSGRYRAGQIAGNLYTSNVSIEEILSLLPRKIESNPSGIIEGIDLYLQGPPEAVNIKGKFKITQLNMPKFVLSDAPGQLAFIFRRSKTGFSPFGGIHIAGGKVSTKNAVLKLDQSSISLNGNFAEPGFDIKGTSSIGKVDIDVALLGTPKAPQWKFNSNPPVPEEVLMLMFLTGKSMDSVQASVEEKRLTPDLAKDLVDYLFLGGEGGRLAQKLGIKDVSIIYEKDVAGIGVKKEVTDFLDVGYQVEQVGVDSQAADLRHTLGADVKLNKHISLEVDKELYQYHNQERYGDPIKPDDKILLKFKTTF